MLKNVAVISILCLPFACIQGKKQYPKGTVVNPERVTANDLNEMPQLEPTKPTGGVREGSYQELSPEEHAKRLESVLNQDIIIGVGGAGLTRSSDFLDGVKTLPMETWSIPSLGYFSYEGFFLRWDQVNQKSLQLLEFYEAYQGTLDLKSFGKVKMGESLTITDQQAFLNQLFKDITGLEQNCGSLCTATVYPDGTVYEIQFGSHEKFSLVLTPDTNVLRMVKMNFSYNHSSVPLSFNSDANSLSLGLSKDRLTTLIGTHEDVFNEEVQGGLYSNSSLLIFLNNDEISSITLNNSWSALTSTTQYQGKVNVGPNTGMLTINQEAGDLLTGEKKEKVIY